MEDREKELLERRRNVALGLIIMPLLDHWMGTDYCDSLNDDSINLLYAGLEPSLDKMIDDIADEGGDVLEIEDSMETLKDAFRAVLDEVSRSEECSEEE